MKSLYIILCLMLLPLSAWASPDLFSEPCAHAGIPQELAVAIARQESSLHPWAINVQGKDFMPRSYDEAARIIQTAQEAGKSYDVGIMQINNEWTRRWRIDPLILLDPVTNVRLGVSILEQEIKRHGMGWLAVGKYHSPNMERGRIYAWRVYQRMKGEKNETMFATGETPAVWSEIPCHNSGIWRNHGIERKGRIITFRVHKESLSGQQDTKPGGSASPEGTVEGER